MSEQTRRHIQFGVFFQGVNFSTVWHWPESGSQTDFESFRRIAQTAERGIFAAFFLGEGLRLREHLGKIHDLDVVGRHDPLTLVAALAGITDKIGLAVTQSTTFNEPADLAYRLANLNLISGGRAAWNMVTTHNAWTGENFRRGGYLDAEDRYNHAESFVRAVNAVWDAWEADSLATSTCAESWSKGDHTAVYKDDYYDIAVQRTLPAVPNGRVVTIQAGDSSEGRDFAVRNANIIFSAHAELNDAATFAADIRQREAAAGRKDGDLKIFPGQIFILDDTEKAAQEKARWIHESQITPETAVKYLEQFWGRDLGEFAPDGPFPDVDPVVATTGATRGTGFQLAKAQEMATKWRTIAQENNFTLREFVIHWTSQGLGRGLVGTPLTIADEIQKYVDNRAVDGFNITPFLVPSGLDDIVNDLIPELQNRDLYPTEYAGDTLREHLGIS
ncbi:MAG TPA: NtaA/DmoA family FMN-dependent monooxygenase [Thermomicrobiales bacterium]|nr:NtaA/DmoA family FMN-dependent monooxygenase [Thermomicrobiales bacterium]